MNKNYSKFFFLKIRKGIEFSPNYEPEFDKLAQELARTVTGDSINDILIQRENKQNRQKSTAKGNHKL